MMWNLGPLLAQADCKDHCCELPLALTFLYLSSGEVFQGTWNRMRIAIKVLKADGGATPSSAVRSPFYCR